ncbi:hypothetical protein BC936DRAFT_144304, partial [Jimgerdemannia flammicorona]
MDGLLFTML